MGERGKETRTQKRKVGTVRWPLGAGQRVRPQSGIPWERVCVGGGHRINTGRRSSRPCRAQPRQAPGAEPWAVPGPWKGAGGEVSRKGTHAGR